jgi:hypothetical protein
MNVRWGWKRFRLSFSSLWRSKDFPFPRRKRLVAVAAEFLKAFPMLEDVLIESWQEGMGTSNPYTNTLPRRGYGRSHSVADRVIACANRNCKGGGFDILQDISKMVHERLTMKEFVQVCCGNEGSGRDCVNTLRYRLTLEYTPGKSPDSP